MSDHPNVAMIRRGYEAFGRGDMQTLTEIFSPDIVWNIPGKSPLAGTYKGQAEVFDFFGMLAERAGGSFQMEIGDMLGNDEHVVVILRERASRDGRTLDEPAVHVWRIRDGRAAEFSGLTADLYAADAFS